MTVNIKALTRHIGKTYQEVLDAGLIPYRTKPKGYPGDPEIGLGMVKEGGLPNELPTPLKNDMFRQWVHETFGEPDKCSPPEIIMNEEYGRTD